MQRSLVCFQQATPRKLDDLVAAVRKGDARTTKQLAHSLKGSCGYVGATTLRTVLLRLELASKAAIDDGTPLGMADEHVTSLRTEFERLVGAHQRYLNEKRPTEEVEPQEQWAIGAHQTDFSANLLDTQQYWLWRDGLPRVAF